jgi:hypothetical protein
MSKKKTKDTSKDPENNADLPGDPQYSASEDIYSKGKKEEDPDLDDSPEMVGRKKKGKSPGDDLDVPGSELDDQDKEIGEEDEENDYYSLGGDDHDDLEEDKGD